MSSLTSMAEAVLVRAKKIDAYLEAQGIAYPSFEGEDTLDRLPHELQDERIALVNSLHDLSQLTRGAELTVMDVALNWVDALGLRVIYHYNLAHAVPVEGSASYAEIAAKSGLEESLCRRFMRLVMGHHVFAENPSDQRVRHTASSRCLVNNAGLRDLVGLQLEDLGPASSKITAVWDEYGQNVAEPNHSAFSVHNDSYELPYNILGKQPERARRFGGAMGYCTMGDRWDLRHILSAFDWKTIDEPGAQIVDVGGGHGTVSKYIAERTNNIKFIVQDLAHVVSHATSLEIPENSRNRLEFAAHDFLTPQNTDLMPDVFLLRWILHNWSDQYAIQILQALVPAMRKGSKVLIYENVLDDRPAMGLVGRFGHQMDGIMAVFFNAQERTVKDFEHLIERADSRFVMNAVRRPPGSAMSIVEIGWTG